jgi:uroporphyrinogen decarboxylase-like protein
VTSREIVQKAIRGERPERLPVLMPGLGVDDTAHLPLKPAASFAPKTEGEDEWHCVWAQTEMANMGQVVGHPLTDIGDLDGFAVPNFADDSRFVEVEEALQRAEAEGKYRMCSIFMVLFERMHTLHGFEKTLMDLYLDRPAMEALADRIADAHIQLVQEVARRFPGRIDGWDMTDDWGTQQNSFVSYDFWMDFFHPRYKRIFDAMHAAGCDVWVHSCGKINNIIEGYIQAGVDVVNVQQPRALGIAEIGELYAGRIAFSTLADIQATLPTGDWDAIESDVEALMTHWASADGGLIFSDYGDNEAIGVTDDATKPFMYDVFSRWSQRVYGSPLPPRRTDA